jgi:hypothetical protein
MPGGASGDGSSSGGGTGGLSGGGDVRGMGGSFPAGGAGGGAAAGGAEGEECEPLPGGVGGMEGAGDCSGEVGSVPGETEAERQARLEKELERQVGGFDEVLAEEQEEISTVGRNTEGFGGSGGSGGGVGLGKQASGGSDSGQATRKPSGESGSGLPSISDISEEEIAKRTPEDIPDLVSEDIVAKQLREAALAEDDPVLRERLWEEYRKYNRL